MSKAPVYETDNFAAFEMRGAGMLLRHKTDGKEVFFQPGDDAETLRDILASLDEVPENRRDVCFDIACGEYFA